MGVRTWLGSWPAVRQAVRGRPARAAARPRSRRAPGACGRAPPTADRVVGSVCPYCAVGCGQQVYVKDGAVVQIEGDPDSPVSRGRLCPKGSATLQLTTGPARTHEVAVPAAVRERLAADRPRDRDGHGRRAGRRDPGADLAVGRQDGKRVRRTMGIATPGRRHAGQRGELPDQEAVHRARRRPGREPGPGLPQLDRRGAGHVVRPRRLDDLPAGPAARRLHRHRGLQLRRGATRSASSG